MENWKGLINPFMSGQIGRLGLIYSALQKFLNKVNILSNNFWKYVYLKWPLQTIWIEIRPHETWGLIFDPYCLKTRINFCWELFVLHGITLILRISRQTIPEILEGTVCFSKSIISWKGDFDEELTKGLH